MNWRAIRALVAKDLVLFFRNRFIAVITVLSLVMFAVIYFVLPDTVEETLEIGLYAPVVPPAVELMQQADEGLEIAELESEEALREAVSEGEYIAGLVFPADIMEEFAAGRTPDIVMYVASDTPEEVGEVVSTLVTEMAYLQTGMTLNIELQPEVLGRDMAGAQVPQRDRMRSLFAVFILMTETFGLAALLSEEFERRTAWALLVTPVSVKDLFTAKGILGTLLAFSEAVLLLAVVGGMSAHPVIILLSLLLGSVLVTGIAFIMASLGKDFMSVTAWGVPVMVLLVVPAIGVMIPGALSGWIKVIPSYYLTDTIYRVSNYGAGWGDVWNNLAILAGINAAIVAIGIWALRRKLQWA